MRAVYSRAAAGVLLYSLSVAAADGRQGIRPPSPKPTPAALTTQKIAAASAAAVVTILVFDQNGQQISQGSGFIVRPQGVIITNWHVMVGAARASVTLGSGEVFERVAFLEGDEAADLALLKIPGFALPTVRVTAGLPEVGTKVVALGSPLGLEGTVSEGIVSAIRLVNGRQFVQISAPISPGSSGGPVLDSSGRVFAVASATIEGAQQLNFSVPVKYAMGLIDSAKERTLSEVFAANAGKSPASGSATADAFARTATPREDLEGTYLVFFGTASGVFSKTGSGILLSGRSVGLIGIDKGGEAPRAVEPLDPLRTNAKGEVAFNVRSGEMAGGGYQTNEGFFLSISSPDILTPAFTMRAVRLQAPISHSSGLYSVTSRTRATVDGSDMGNVDWAGEAAVIVADNRVYVDMMMLNKDGGGQSFSMGGPIEEDGSFRLVPSEGTMSLAGTVRAGSLQARWVLKRATNGMAVTFEGDLRGVRK